MNGKEISDPKKIANELNSYFCSTAKRVQSEDPAINRMGATPNFEFFIKKLPKSLNTFLFKRILPQDVMKATQKQKNSKSGNIPTCFLKDTTSSVTNPLSTIFSKSLKQGKYPDNLKLSRISAFYKGKGSKSNPDHYRPISVLSAVATLFEKLVHQQLFPHLKDLLSVNQSGFKPGHSTETSLLNTTNSWIINMDKGYFRLRLHGTRYVQIRLGSDPLWYESTLFTRDWFEIGTVQFHMGSPS